MTNPPFDLYQYLKEPYIKEDDVVEILEKRLNIDEIGDLLLDSMYSWEDLLNYESDEIADILYDYNPDKSQVERSKEIFDHLQSLRQDFEALQTEKEGAKPFGILQSTLYRGFLKTVLGLYIQHHPEEDVHNKIESLVELFWYKSENAEHEFNNFILPNLGEKEKVIVKQLIRITDYHMVENLGFVHPNSDELFPDVGYNMKELVHHMHIHWMKIFVELELEKKRALE